MFTGLIQSLGSITQLNARQLEVASRISSLGLGESVAVNGVCLTVTKSKKINGTLRTNFDLSPETWKKTSFSSLKIGSIVNLERCATLNTLLGGHLVQGHVDGVGKVQSLDRQGRNKELTFQGPADLIRYVVPKGSVTVNGVSLTAVNVKKTSFSVALIPFTLHHTNLGNLKVGDRVNLEADVLAKYVEKLIRK